MIISYLNLFFINLFAMAIENVYIAYDTKEKKLTLWDSIWLMQGPITLFLEIIFLDFRNDTIITVPNIGSCSFSLAAVIVTFCAAVTHRVQVYFRYKEFNSYMLKRGKEIEEHLII